MATILGFLRRKAPAEADAARSRAAAPAAPLAPAPAPSSKAVKDKDEGATELVADLAPARRQASQLNLNRYFASAPAGLTAVLKQPSRPDLEASKSGGSGSLQSSASAPPASQQQQQQSHSTQSGGAPDAPPPARPMRERRRSMTVTEIAQSMQNIDVSQAALIMMPNRMRKELGQASFTQTQQQQAAMQLQLLQQAMAGGGGGPPPVLGPSQLPQLNGRSNGQLQSLISSDLNTASGAAPTATATGPASPLGSGAPLFGPRLERKPSIIREAVKLTQQGQQPGAEVQLRTHAGNFSGDLQSAPLTQIASAVAGQGPERFSGGPERQPGQRRASQLITTQQLGMGPPGSRTALNAGSGGALSPSAPLPMALPQPPGTPGGLPRRSDQGEPSYRGGGRPVGGVGMGMSMGMGYGMGRAPGEESGAPAGYMANRNGRGVMANRNGGGGGDQLYLQQQQHAEDETQQASGGDVKLPSIGVGGPRRVNGDTRDKDGGGGGGRAGLTAADVAALSEAIASYQSEAARLRAAALRKVDTRIKRAVMERHQNGAALAEDDTSPLGGNDSSSSNPLAPLLRSPVAAGNSRTALAQASPTGRGGRLPLANGAGTGPSSGDLLGRGRQRL